MLQKLKTVRYELHVSSVIFPSKQWQVKIQLLFCPPLQSTRYVMIESPDWTSFTGQVAITNRIFYQHNCRLICYTALSFIALERRWYNASLSRASNPLALPKLLTAFFRSSPCKGKGLELDKMVLWLDKHTPDFFFLRLKSCYWCYKQKQHT